MNTHSYSEEMKNDQDIHSNQCKKSWLWRGVSLRKTGESPSVSLGEEPLNFLETDTLEAINSSISW